MIEDRHGKILVVFEYKTPWTFEQERLKHEKNEAEFLAWKFGMEIPIALAIFY